MRKDVFESLRARGKKLFTGFMAMTVGASTMLGMGATTAFAAETTDNAPGEGQVTVSLAEADYGSLAFHDADGQSIVVDVGTEVSVDVKPDDGYYAANVSIVKESTEEVVPLEVSSTGDVTFTADDDIIVAALFAEGQPAVAAEVAPADVLTVPERILRDADRDIVGDADELVPADVLTVSSTVVNGNFPGTTIDELWLTDNDGDGESDYLDCFISDSHDYIYLYEMGKDSDYYVGYAGGFDRDARFLEAVAGLDDFTGTVLDDVLYDQPTGMVYVPKSYRSDDDGNVVLGKVRLQILYQVAGMASEHDVQVVVNASGVDGDVAPSGIATVNVADAAVSVQIANDEASAEAIGEDTIDEVRVNGVPLVDDAWSYSDGSLTVMTSPTAVDTIEVDMSNTAGKAFGSILSGVSNWIAPKAYAATLTNVDANMLYSEPLRFSEFPKAGDQFKFSSVNGYSELGGAEFGYTHPACTYASYAIGDDFDSMVKTIVNAGGLSQDDVNHLWRWNSSLYRYARIGKQSAKATNGSNSVTLPKQTNIIMYCTHTAVPGDDGGGDAGIEKKSTVRMTVLSVDSTHGLIVVGFVNPEMNGQTGAGIYVAKFELDGGYARIQKFKDDEKYISDSNKSKYNYIDGNNCYSIKGATYYVYSDSACTKRVTKDMDGKDAIFVVKDDETGLTNTLHLKADTYYVKETNNNADSFKGYGITSGVIKLTVEAGTTASAPYTLKMDVQKMLEPTIDGDPPLILVKKAIEDWNEERKPEGDIADLGHVRFRIDYYAHGYSSINDLDKSDLRASAVWETDEDGFMFFDDAPVEGSWPYKMSGANTIPLGTVVITEVSTPDGMQASGSPKAFVMKDSDGDGKVDKPVTALCGWDKIEGAKVDWSGDVPGWVNRAWKGGITVVKADEELSESYEQGDGDLTVTYEVINKSINSVTIDDGKTEVKPGEVVTTITTKYDEGTKRWVATTGNNILPYGTYQLREVTTHESYENAEWLSPLAVIHEDGQMVEFNGTDNEWNVNSVRRGGVIIGKVDNENKQYIPLGEAELAGATFELVNESRHDVLVDVNGDGVRDKETERFAPGSVITTLTAEELEWNGQTVYAAKTSEDFLPYGRYSVTETSSGVGYLYNKLSKSWKRTFSVGYEASGVDAWCNYGELADLTGTDKAAVNQVKREDFNFTKKRQDGDMERMDYIAFLLTSKTTGESHVIVTDENGAWGSDCLSDEDESEWPLHTDKTNANDPDSPTSNGAVQLVDGEYVVVDSSKLDPTAGTWFTGMDPSITKWSEDGKSYDVNGVTVPVNDALRAFPYDTYTMQELRCDGNRDTGLVTVTVTLHKFSRNEDGKGINIDYGTIDDKTLEIGTTLTDAEGGKVAAADSELVLVDEVEYEGLTKGKTYQVEGVLHSVDAEGNDLGVVAEASTEFECKKANGKVKVTFEFDASSLAGGKLVAFETMYSGNTFIAEHADLTDEDQTVEIPTIGTKATAVDENEGDASAETIKIEDVVSYSGLEKGKTYQVSGTLHLQNVDENGNISDGGIVKDAEGKEVTASASFKASATSGEAKVTFEFSNPGNLAGKSVVAFEEVSKNGVTFATHADITDEGQTVDFPKVATTATDKSTGKHEAVAGGELTIVDKVELTNLTVGKEYTVTGTLHKKVVDEDGNVSDGGEVKGATATKTFTAGEKNLTMDLEFTIDSSELAGTDLVVFENLTRGKTMLGAHADINDEGQTIHIPGIGTTATSKVTGNHMVEKAEDVVIVDTVDYKGLTVGETYQLRGTLHAQKVDDKGNVTDAGVLKDADGKEVTAVAEFKAEKSEGQATIEFAFKMPEGAAGQSYVAFEDLYHGDLLVATHADITDEAQTVRLMAIGTTLTGADKKSKTVQQAEKVEMVDTVAFENLVPGETYVIKGKLVDKDGKDISGATAEAEFTPDKSSGTVEMKFTVDTSKMADKSAIVAFEYIYDKDNHLLASHEDLKDESQTVTVDVNSKTPVSLQTGIGGIAWPLAIVTLLAAGAAVVLVMRRRLTTE